MATDYLKTTDFLNQELDAFYRVLRRGSNGSERQAAIDRLRAVVSQTEPLEEPGEQWRNLAQEQRWGYLRMVSHLGTALHELKRVSNVA